MTLELEIRDPAPNSELRTTPFLYGRCCQCLVCAHSALVHVVLVCISQSSGSGHAGQLKKRWWGHGRGDAAPKSVAAPDVAVCGGTCPPCESSGSPRSGRQDAGGGNRHCAGESGGPTATLLAQCFGEGEYFLNGVVDARTVTPDVPSKALTDFVIM